MTEKIALRISELEAVGPLRRTRIYELIRDGALPARKVGRATFVMKEDWQRFLAAAPSLPTRAGT